MPVETQDNESRRHGPVPRASRDDVLSAALQRFADCERIDVQALAGDLGVGRATIYRWFGSREGLLGEVLVSAASYVIHVARRDAKGRGGRRLLDTFDRINRALASAPSLRHFLHDERATALRMVASGGGPVQPEVVRQIREIIDEEGATGRYHPPTDSETLAYAIVKLAEAFLFNDAIADIRGDVERLRTIEAALLGVPAR
jgi:AcrR family transcriptional regulator